MKAEQRDEIPESFMTYGSTMLTIFLQLLYGLPKD